MTPFRFNAAVVSNLGRCFLIICLLAIFAGNARAQTEITLQGISRVWKARQDRVRTARFVWTESRTYAKGSLPSMKRPEPGQTKPKPVPPEDVTNELHLELSVDGDMMRFAT